MKKLVIISLVCVFGFMKMQAEETRRFAPEQGQFSIGFDVTPIFNFAGNIFNNTVNNTLDPLSGTPVWDNSRAVLLPSASIMGKYMFTNN
ncbi:MAG: hypothetical protein FWC98_04350, partial [Bacteroidales bacterium]|nr:hypothetical protein [Bacteroidales bacterium]